MMPTAQTLLEPVPHTCSRPALKPVATGAQAVPSKCQASPSRLTAQMSELRVPQMDVTLEGEP